MAYTTLETIAVKHTDLTFEQVEADLKRICDLNHTLKYNGDVYIGEIYVDYRDEISNRMISSICNSVEKSNHEYSYMYRDAYVLQVDEWEIDQSCYYEPELKKEIEKEFREIDEDHDLAWDKYEGEIDEWIREYVVWEYPHSYVYGSEVDVTIMIDSGNWNYDCTRDNVLNWDGTAWNQDDWYPEKESSLLWLVRQQKKKLKMDMVLKAINKNRDLGINEQLPIPNDDKFINSCIEEWENLCSSMGTLTFCVRMSIGEFLKLKDWTEEYKRNLKYGIRTEFENKISKSKLTIDKSVTCGLYNPWSGGGSLMEIALEKDVVIPLSMIHYAGCDDGKLYGYGVGEVYGVNRSFWETDCRVEYAEEEDI